MIITSNKQIKGKYERYMGKWGWKPLYQDIYQAYKKPSSRKTQAWEYCKQLRDEYDGEGLVILGHNCTTFSAGFVGYIDGLKHFFYITRDYDRAMPLEKMDAKTGEVFTI